MSELKAYANSAFGDRGKRDFLSAETYEIVSGTVREGYRKTLWHK
jgi:hypothetical protein